MKWRLIGQDSYDAAMNMAIDHAVFESAKPTIRFYKWKNNSVSIGAQQNQNEVDLDYCSENNIYLVRRMTGGRAVFHGKKDFTYSVIAPLSLFGSIHDAYRQICSCIISALSNLGISSYIQGKNDIVVDGRKISGNSAKLVDGIYLQHGTLVYEMDFSLMPKIFNVPESLARKKITSILQHKKISQDKIYKALKENFVKDKNFEIGKLSKEELKRAEYLAKTKYNSIIPSSGTLLKNKGICYIERN